MYGCHNLLSIWVAYLCLCVKHNSHLLKNVDFLVSELSI